METVFISIMLVFSIFSGGKWIEKKEWMSGTVPVETATCRTLIKDLRGDLGKEPGMRFESAYCREVQQ